MTLQRDIFTDDQIVQLGDNLHPSNVKTLKEGSKAQYIEGWHAIAEANRIFGFGAWDQEVKQIKETNRDLVMVRKERNNQTFEESQWRVGYLMVVRVTVHGEGGAVIFRDGTGFGSGFAKENALGEAIESAAKEAETDALKRALKSFGNQFGLALYDKTKSMVGESVVEQEPAPRPEPPPAQQKIADGIIADFGRTSDADDLWKHPNTQKYMKAWKEEKHNLYEQVVVAARKAKQRIVEEEAAAPKDKGIPFNDDIPF